MAVWNLRFTNLVNAFAGVEPRSILGATGPPAPWERGPLGFVRKHPILFLALLTPGIPEYLSGSSPVSALILNPAQFFIFQLPANLGLYTAGVLLIREARVRWHKGWPTVLLLGAAYGVLEEGIALSTLFNPSAGPVGALGYYGHWLGVSWVWVAGILLVHMIFSIAMPILLLDLAVPQLREVSLLSKRRIAVVATILTLDVLLLSWLVSNFEHFWMGTPVFLGSILSILGLIYLARRTPASLPQGKPNGPRFGLKTTALAGAMVYTGILFIEGLTGKTAAVLTFALVLAYEAGCLWWVLSYLNFPNNERYLLALSLGLTIPILVFGVVSQFPFDLVLVVDLALVLLFSNLYKMYPTPGPLTATEPDA